MLLSNPTYMAIGWSLVKKRTCLLFKPLFWHTRGHLLLVCSVQYHPDHPRVADDPEKHVSGVQQNGHGQLRGGRRRGRKREIHICPVLLGEK